MPGAGSHTRRVLNFVRRSVARPLFAHAIPFVPGTHCPNPSTLGWSWPLNVLFYVLSVSPPARCTDCVK